MVGVIIIVVLFLGYLSYDKYESKKETKVLIRELTVALKSEDVVSYIDNTPVYKDEEIVEIIKDELVPIEDIDPTQLLRSITTKK